MVSMKKLINDPADVVSEALRGMAAAHPDRLRVDLENRIVYRKEAPRSGKVGLISGGGSGHEPMHGGFVGTGMLDAACAGEVFTSPVPDQMMAATKAVDAGAGVLHIVKNYTGDMMNFDMAAELAAAETGITVEAVVVNDDVAVEDSLYTAGRRGVGVTVLLEKLVGAAAEEGRSLPDLVTLARTINDSGRSMGMALTSCTVPAAGKPTFELGEDEMELGIGIHGEPGRRRVALAGAREIAEQLMEPVLDDLDFTSSPVIVMLNGMGGTPLVELYLMYGEVAKIMDQAGITIARNLVGNYITSLGHPAPGGPGIDQSVGCSGKHCRAEVGDLEMVTSAVITIEQLTGWLRRFQELVIKNQTELTELDSAIGDADHGINMARGMTAVINKLDGQHATHANDLFKTVAMTLVTSVGGASGPLYGTFFLRFAGSTGPAVELDTAALVTGLDAGLAGIIERGKAQPGDKTMVDALSPALEAMEAVMKNGGDLVAAATAGRDAAVAGRDATVPMVARKGRASYLGERSAGHMDPGAASVALLFEALTAELAG
jgi:triose/dihydroxyacetone kinase / FAD-AMP lyase (cyclizing)